MSTYLLLYEEDTFWYLATQVFCAAYHGYTCVTKYRLRRTMREIRVIWTMGVATVWGESNFCTQAGSSENGGRHAAYCMHDCAKA
jgi:hypothetical protein